MSIKKKSTFIPCVAVLLILLISLAACQPIYRVTVTAGEGGTVAGDGVFLENESVTVVATADDGFVFEGWWLRGTLHLTEPVFYSPSPILTFFMPPDHIVLEARFLPAEEG